METALTEICLCKYLLNCCSLWMVHWSESTFNFVVPMTMIIKTFYTKRETGQTSVYWYWEAGACKKKGWLGPLSPFRSCSSTSSNRSWVTAHSRPGSPYGLPLPGITNAFQPMPDAQHPGTIQNPHTGLTPSPASDFAHLFSLVLVLPWSSPCPVFLP